MGAFDTILVANRGEIAMRIMRSARELGYRTVSIYSDADADLPHARGGDRSVCIGEAPAARSYLNIDRIVETAKRSGANAIHPGYGFLSENADFADACARAGLVFIGPPGQAIRAMANKAEAKRLMIQHEVPCVPGYDGADQSDEALAQEAGRIGYPIMLKAVAGGGGKGMRLVKGAADFADALARARSEATRSFGNGEIMIEKAIVAPRHVEVQVFADAYGNVVHLGDRDCSIQRRHQKVIEEAPAPNLSDDLRKKMAQAAVNAARAVDYRGAGTVEFLVTSAGDFYFLEMNTRLQVEHPVTEMVTGLDLVAWQIQVAAGQPLPLRQEDISLSGHAIEARLYAEDEAFLPQSGRIVAWRPPAGAGIRVDHGLEEGAFVSPHYDPMVAKVIGFGRDREEAARRLKFALESFVVAGLTTNRRFLVDVIAAPAFSKMQLDTGFLETNELLKTAPAARPGHLLAIAAALIRHRSACAYPAELRNWRSRPWAAEAMLLELSNEVVSVQVDVEGADQYVIEIGGETHRVEIGDIGTGHVCHNEIARHVDILWVDDVLWLSEGCDSFAAREHRVLGRASEEKDETCVVAPMPGVVMTISVEIGEEVAKGQTLVTMEAMKMEHPLLARMPGKVVAVHAVAGAQVLQRQLLVEIEPAAHKN